MGGVPAGLSPFAVGGGRVGTFLGREGDLRGRPEVEARLPLLPPPPLLLALLLLLLLPLVVMLVVGFRLEFAFLLTLPLLGPLIGPLAGSLGNAGGGCFVEHIPVVDRLEPSRRATRS